MACKKVASKFNNLSKSTPKIVTMSRAMALSRNNGVEKMSSFGRVFVKDEGRKVRFAKAAHYMSENWGLKLVGTVPPKECTEDIVFCDGGNGPLCHRKMCINLNNPGAHTCQYCGLRFVKKGSSN